MKSQQKIKFDNLSKQSFENKERKHILSNNINKYIKKFVDGKKQFSNYDGARKKLHYLKFKAIEQIDKLLQEFDISFTERGGKFLYASDSEEALKYIGNIIIKEDAQSIVKAKSMVCEEIGLEEYLKKRKIKFLETDLGEFLVQLAEEKPSHIISPALHKSKKEIYDLLNNKYDQSFDEKTNVEEVVRFVRQLLREEFLNADIGISGCNFLISDIGAVSITENEGNAILSTSMPKTHIVVTTIEKVLPNLNNLELFLTMLATHGTGQNLSVYNSLILGPSKTSDNPQNIYVIVVDNGRSQLLEDTTLRESLYCIKCGACHNHCPVYKSIGGHTYDSVYNGPIGSIISPFIFGKSEFMHLPFASTLCGKCNEVCPVKINITNLLIYTRKKLLDEKYRDNIDKYIHKRMQYFLKKRKRMDMFSAKIKNIGLKISLRNNWGVKKSIPKFAENSFNKLQKQK